MYRCLTWQGKQWIFNKNTARIDRIKSELIYILSPETNRKQLAHVLKIFPTFFDKEYVEEFSQCQNIEKYLKYINYKKPSRSNVTALQKYFKQQKQKQIQKKNILNTFNSLNIIYLEAYLHWLTNQCTKFNTHDNDYLMEVLNLYRPDKWYQTSENPQKRVFIYHHGPTNSGKSTSAIQELKQLSPNQKGIYMAPLRLLAWQYQQKLGNCSLITGQQKEYKNSNLVSCTIEAAQLKEEYQVAVIDQIQMIRDTERGWSWTRAVLAVKAKRVHLCGDERALGIITKLLQLTGDILQQRRYSRLSKLTLIHKSFKLDKIEQGDCIINFSMKKLMDHRNDINKMKNLQMKQSVQKQQKSNEGSKDIILKNNNYTAIVYGKLPPECRKEQANLFNKKYLPYLVATNAIGMGLNLNIKKIVFMDITRARSDQSIEELEDHEIQQIAGRAGRGKQTGYVQCANNHILNRVKKALSTVNQQYGIQLQNLKDETEEDPGLQVLEVNDLKKKKKSQKYNSLLQRYMTEKECHISQACFYFTTDYIVYFKNAMESLMERELPIMNLIQFMKMYTKLSDLYFIQENKHMKYMMNLLQDNNYDIFDLFTFYNGLSLSMMTHGRNRKFVQQIENAHRNFVQDFVKYRKVKLPKFILTQYEDQFKNYQYMDQINELQGYFNVLQTYVWLWNKYQFAFFQIGRAKSIKILLSQKINQILLENKFREKSQNTKVEVESETAQNKKIIYKSFQEAKRIKIRQRQPEKSSKTSISKLIEQKLMSQSVRNDQSL